jgi:hypothetical protein
VGPARADVCRFFLIGVETFLVSPLLPQIALSLNVTIAAGTAIVTTDAVVYTFAAPLLGNFADRWPRKRSVIVGAIVFLVGNIGSNQRIQLRRTDLHSRRCGHVIEYPDCSNNRPALTNRERQARQAKHDMHFDAESAAASSPGQISQTSLERH